MLLSAPRRLTSLSALAIASALLAAPPAGGQGKAKDEEKVGELRRFEGHKGMVDSVAFSPCGKLAASGSHGHDDADGNVLEFHVRLWDLDGGQPLLRLLKGHAGGVRGVAFSPDGKHVLSGSTDGTARLWDVATGKEVREFKQGANVWSVAFSPDGKALAAGDSDHVIGLWDVATGKRLREFRGHEWGVIYVTFSPDGKRLLSAGSYDNSARLWDVGTGKELRRFPGLAAGVMTAVFSPDGKRVLTTTGGPGSSQGGVIQLWDLESGQEVRRFVGHQMWTHSVAFSPDGKRILSGSSDKTARLWDTETGKELHQFTGHTAAVNRVAFSPDGRRALTGSYDHTIRLWALPK